MQRKINSLYKPPKNQSHSSWRPLLLSVSLALVPYYSVSGIRDVNATVLCHSARQLSPSAEECVRAQRPLSLCALSLIHI